MKTKDYDLIIIGGGMVGSTLACLMAQGFAQNARHAKKRIAVIEAFEPSRFDPQQPYDLRVSAISAVSRQILQQTGVWQALQNKRISPYEAMHVWDGTGDGEIHFNAAEIGVANLGHIIENNVIQSSLAEKISQFSNIDWLCPQRLKALRIEEDHARVTLDDNTLLTTHLVVGADGAHSKCRELAGIAVDREHYGQSGLVAVVTTEVSHQATAWQRFMPSGPLAFLPLADGSSSIVWTLPSDRCPAYVAMDESKFKSTVAETLDYKLGAITSVSQRAAFPFYGSQAKNYVKPRIALIGDAAHTIHPLAGQGVNLGIKDAAALAKQLLKTPTADLGLLKGLRRYERARRGDNVTTMRAMEGFRLLFGHSNPFVMNVRNLGLNALNKLPVIKNEIIRKAMGV
ncbi:MAG: UbiH/UbiF/VisC/COQ6 family ubiquinone biosynthesis hydroxylase [Cocleimonas sp.]|nr:UbiH/UbiF/VisC/COQ6 family ubiquinone biosynthesis hydroxylase [Cocleimonas sp.]